MACDLSIMAEDSFLYLAFSGLSLVPDGGMSHHLVNAMGYRKAYQLYLEAGRITAQDCESYGLANKVVAPEALGEQTQAWAESLTEGAPLSQKFGKQIMRQVSTSSFEDTFDKESKLQVTCSTSNDAQRGIAAFFNKEKAVFEGD
jgi:2-(1,2-epoxy-1,2-dihydrophenyl)acetyl-CoA isomerase